MHNNVPVLPFLQKIIHCKTILQVVSRGIEVVSFSFLEVDVSDRPQYS